MRRAIICGSRDWIERAPIRRLLQRMPQEITIVTGGARGADRIAHNEATNLGFATEVYRANWDAHGKAAGFRRNEQMLALENVGWVFAFRKGEVSNGTDHMTRIATRAGKYVGIARRP